MLRLRSRAITILLFGIIAPGAASAQGDTAVRTFRDGPQFPQMVVIPAGSFEMGSPSTEVGRFENEGPQHTVRISKPFAMAAFDVTRREYRRFASDTGRRPNADCRIYDGKNLVRLKGTNWKKPYYKQTSRDPVVCVSWDGAQAYVAWLNQSLQKKFASARKVSERSPYRLPTEAEWEYAARAGSTTPFHWGSAARREAMNYGPDEPRFAPVALGADRWQYTSPVGAFPPNAFGLFDMAGNVWQFTQDCWAPTYANTPRDGSAMATAKCEERAVRGGSWFKPPAGERSAKRGEGKPVDLGGSSEIGFRVVRDLDQH